jgi:hypothetical protein
MSRLQVPERHCPCLMSSVVCVHVNACMRVYIYIYIYIHIVYMCMYLFMYSTVLIGNSLCEYVCLHTHAASGHTHAASGHTHAASGLHVFDAFKGSS